jgi:gliding motility-associated-like protein
MLNNNSRSSIPTPHSVFSTGLPVIGFLWQGPSPQVDQNNSSTYVAQAPGDYTMTAKDLNNGCTTFTTFAVQDAKLYPHINEPDAPAMPVIDCGGTGTAKVYAFLTQTLGPTYQWTGPFDGDGDFTGTPTVQCANCATFVTNLPGRYVLLVTNSVNGCASSKDIQVIQGSLTANAIADYTFGFVPLTVNFENRSTSTLGNGSITSIWNFGNGTVATYSTVANASAVYTRPGTYTVQLYVAKGQCNEKAKPIVITVDIPSELVIPNVFTPNNDGVNDIFWLRASNLTDISIWIYDRWGRKVFESNSDTGNIAWDGKSGGKDVAEGTYFYVLKATGKEGNSYEKKGTINLYR